MIVSDVSDVCDVCDIVFDVSDVSDDIASDIFLSLSLSDVS